MVVTSTWTGRVLPYCHVESHNAYGSAPFASATTVCNSRLHFDLDNSRHTGRPLGDTLSSGAAVHSSPARRMIVSWQLFVVAAAMAGAVAARAAFPGDADLVTALPGAPVDLNLTMYAGMLNATSSPPSSRDRPAGSARRLGGQLFYWLCESPRRCWPLQPATDDVGRGRAAARRVVYAAAAGAWMGGSGMPWEWDAVAVLSLHVPTSSLTSAFLRCRPRRTAAAVATRGPWSVVVVRAVHRERTAACCIGFSAAADGRAILLDGSRVCALS